MLKIFIWILFFKKTCWWEQAGDAYDVKEEAVDATRSFVKAVD